MARNDVISQFVSGYGPTETFERVEEKYGNEAPTLAATRMAHSRFKAKQDWHKEEIRDLLIQEEIWRQEISPDSSMPGYIQVKYAINIQ